MLFIQAETITVPAGSYMVTSSDANGTKISYFVKETKIDTAVDKDLTKKGAQPVKFFYVADPLKGQDYFIKGKTTTKAEIGGKEVKFKSGDGTGGNIQGAPAVYVPDSTKLEINTVVNRPALIEKGSNNWVALT